MKLALADPSDAPVPPFEKRVVPPDTVIVPENPVRTPAYVMLAVSTICPVVSADVMVALGPELKVFIVSVAVAPEDIVIGLANPSATLLLPTALSVAVLFIVIPPLPMLEPTFIARVPLLSVMFPV